MASGLEVPETLERGHQRLSNLSAYSRPGGGAARPRLARVLRGKSREGALRHKAAKVWAELRIWGDDSAFPPSRHWGKRMLASRRNRAFLVVTALLTIIGTELRADELLVMPYTCAVVGGQPVLAPSHDEGHRIYGQREQRAFTACSPANPNACKQWTVHRFDLDCGGVRVPWVSVATAAGGLRNARAWVEDGRVRLQMDPWWNMEPGDPCARAPMYDDRWQSGRLARYCADRRALLPPPIVDMPAGFSPMLGTNGIFVAAAAPRIGAGAMPPVAAGVVAPPAPPNSPRRSEPAPHEGTPKEVAKPRSATPPATPLPSPPTVEVAAPSAPAGTPIRPRIINRVESAPEDPPPTVLPQTPPASSEGAAKFAANAPDMAKRAPVQANPPTATGDVSDDKWIAVNILSAIGGRPTATLVAFTALTGFVVAAFVWLRRRERTAVAGAPTRDLASVTLGRRVAVPALVAGSLPQPSRQAPGLQPVQFGNVAVRWPDAVPRTRTEALAVLGMGVTPDATEVAVKRIVDGLRLSWHPDHAKGPEDRQIRELRLKQINAAWEIITGKRQEARGP